MLRRTVPIVAGDHGDPIANRNVLVMQGGPGGTPSPNGGVLRTIGAGLGFDSFDLIGFNVSGTTGH
jgi:hypothetical protein